MSRVQKVMTSSRLQLTPLIHWPLGKKSKGQGEIAQWANGEMGDWAIGRLGIKAG